MDHQGAAMLNETWIKVPRKEFYPGGGGSPYTRYTTGVKHFEALFAYIFLNLPCKGVQFLALAHLIQDGVESRIGTPEYKNRDRGPPWDYTVHGSLCKDAFPPTKDPY